jgi:hypothetical protein
MTFDPRQIHFSDLSSVDDNGRVFFLDGHVFRAIKQEATERVRELFSCGLVGDLVEQGLLPETWITEHTLEGYGMVLEHTRCQPVTYPYEWSFSMLRDAALTVLRANLVGRKYGYQTKDCHGFNIVFDGTSPRFVDLGSFVKVSASFKGWLAFEEFLCFYYYPLRIWKDGNGFIARKMLQGNPAMPPASYLLYRFPICRSLNHARQEKFARLFLKLKVSSPESLRQKDDGLFMNLVRKLAKRNLLPFMKVDLPAWIDRIERLSLKKFPTMWGGYHNEFSRHGNIVPTPRFERVLDLVGGLNPSSILELAGNQGILSTLLAEALPGIPVICSDYDEIAVDVMYRTTRERGARISPVLLDFMYPVLTSTREHPTARLRSQVVLALAVTHHLLLTACLNIETVLRTIASYSAEYVLIEFMPLGLHDGTSTPPIPSWYSVDWFRSNFAKQFELLLEEKLEENRILFVGRLRGKA